MLFYPTHPSSLTPLFHNPYPNCTHSPHFISLKFRVMERKAHQLRVFDDLKSDEFVVDDLFDFSDGEFENNFSETVEDEKEDKVYSVPISTLNNWENAEDKCFGSVSSSELGIPVDDVADLEWLSHFVEDSFPTYSVPFQMKPTEKMATNLTRKPVSETPVWSDDQTDVCGVRQPRRCSHCRVQSTPQWRGGPMGPKTLCNACGVRYKSGRLLPEYRPACSPTFSSEVHSNNHRKVLEMRRKKEVGTVSGPQGHGG